MDIKLDFVPPSLINFISRQLIGNGFRLYKKAVASMMNPNKEFSKALRDPLYTRIREALYSISGSEAMDGEEHKQVASILPSEDLVERKQDGAKDVSQKDKNNQCANSFMSVAVNTSVPDNSKAFGEIVEADSEEIVQIEEDDKNVNEVPNEEVDASLPKGKRSTCISSEVEQALETLEKAILVVREYGFRSHGPSISFANEESPCTKKSGRIDSYSAKLIQQCSKNEVSVEVSNRDILEETSQAAPGTNSDFQSFRYTRTNPNLKEVNSNKVVPTSPGQNPSRPIDASQVASYSLKTGETLDQTCANKQLNTNSVQDMSSDDPNKSSRQKRLNTVVAQGMLSDVPKKPRRRKKYRYCCFLH